MKPRMVLTGDNGMWSVGEGYIPWSDERGGILQPRELVRPLYMDEGVLLEVRMYLDYLLREAQVSVLRHWVFLEGEKLEDILLKRCGVVSRLRWCESCGGALYRANEVGSEVILEESVGISESPVLLE